MTVTAGTDRGKGIIVTTKMDSMEGYNCVRRAGQRKEHDCAAKADRSNDITIDSRMDRREQTDEDNSPLA